MGGTTILITGGSGNLGTKLAAYLSPLDWVRDIVLLDVTPPPALPAKTRFVASDLDRPQGRWREAVADADAIVHFAAVNPYPGASFAEAAGSFDMTSRLFLAAAQGKPKRVVFASSNHVMGRYKEENPAPGTLTPDLPPLPGTRFRIDGRIEDSPAYGASKLMGERLLLSLAAAGQLTGVALRIGWVQPGENHPRTISHDGLPFGDKPTDLPADAQRDLRWFRNMWLSNRDFQQVFAKAIAAPADNWPAPGLVLNAMSGNDGMAWDLGPTRAALGYAPADNVWDTL